MVVMFWLFLFLAGYSYFIYPAILLLLPRKRHIPSAPSQIYEPSVTVILPAFNEQARIAEKLDNTLALDYPRGKLQIIVTSDASTDGTDGIVASYADSGVALVRSGSRRGKEFAISLAVAEATGEIIVFSDTATIIKKDGLRKLVSEFADPSVGAVSSRDVIIGADEKPCGESLYVRYEMWLRRLESSRNTLVGLSGSFFAVRRELTVGWDHRVPGDFNTAIRCAEMGYRAVSSDDVIGYYKSIADDAREYQRKLRTVVHGIAAISLRRDILNPAQFGFFAFQVWSHKLLRWLVPWLAVIVFMLNTALAVRDGGLYIVLLGLQLLFYLLAWAGFAFENLRKFALVKIPYFFVQVNLALMHAAILYLFGERMLTWAPSVR